MGTWVVELDGLEAGVSGASETAWRFALGRGVACTDAAFIPGGLIRWQSPSQRISIGQAGPVRLSGDQGEVVITNLPPDIEEPGPLDDLAQWAWQGREARLYWLPARVWANKVLSARGVLEQPVAGLIGDATLRFPLRDPRAGLEAPLQATKFAGDNVAPDGVEGAEDLKGKPKPICYGVVSNVPGVLVNFSKQVYQLADKAVTILCVRDGGLPLTASTARANVASMLANAPPPGGYDYVSGAEGTFVRFGHTPVFKVTFDLQEGATEADRTHAQVWKRIRTERCGTDAGDIDDASVTATDTADPKEVGFWWVEETNRKDALDKVLASLSGYEVLTLAGEWKIGRLEAPSGTPDVGLVVVTPSVAMKSTDRPLVALDRARPDYQPNGSPPYRVSVRWGRNHTVMSPADFAGSAAQRLKDKFATEWRVESATEASIWDPETETGDFPNAPEMILETGYQPGADNRTCPHAATLASERLALYTALTGQYQATFTPEPGDAILPGDVAQLTFAGYDLDEGPLFVVLQSGWLIEERKEAQATLVLGLQA